MMMTSSWRSAGRSGSRSSGPKRRSRRSARSSATASKQEYLDALATDAVVVVHLHEPNYGARGA